MGSYVSTNRLTGKIIPGSSQFKSDQRKTEAAKRESVKAMARHASKINYDDSGFNKDKNSVQNDLVKKHHLLQI